MKRVLAAFATVAIGTLVLAGTAYAAGRPNVPGSACQKGGWQEMYRSDGTPFTNQGDCVLYVAAQHGTFQAPCIDGTLSLPDLRLTGPIDTLYNVTDYTSTDGTCGGSNGFTTVVSATSQTQAIAKCDALITNITNVGALQVNGLGWNTAPTDWWGCLVLG